MKPRLKHRLPRPVRTWNIQSSENVLENTISIIEKRYSSKDIYNGLPTGYQFLDDITSGFQKGELVTIGGRTNTGKTNLALNILNSFSVKNKISTGYITLDSTVERLTEKLIGMNARVEFMRIKSGFLKNSEFHLITDAVAKLYDSPFAMLSAPNITINELVIEIKKMVNIHGAECVFVDYISMIAKTDDSVPLWEHFAECTRKLKAVALEEEITVVIIANLNRQADLRQYSDLQDFAFSDTIAQDSDIVMLLDDMNIMKDSIHDSDCLERTLSIVKNNNGVSSVISKLAYLYSYGIYENLTIE